MKIYIVLALNNNMHKYIKHKKYLQPFAPRIQITIRVQRQSMLKSTDQANDPVVFWKLENLCGNVVDMIVFGDCHGEDRSTRYMLNRIFIEGESICLNLSKYIPFLGSVLCVQKVHFLSGHRVNVYFDQIPVFQEHNSGILSYCDLFDLPRDFHLPHSVWLFGYESRKYQLYISHHQNHITPGSRYLSDSSAEATVIRFQNILEKHL